VFDNIEDPIKGNHCEDDTQKIYNKNLPYKMTVA